MEKATPVQMRKALEAVDALRKCGMEFVPIPVLSDIDRVFLLKTLTERLERIENKAG